MVGFVFGAQPLEDEDGVLDARLLDLDLLEAAFERGILLDELAILVHRRRADALELATAEGRLDDVRGVHGTLGGTRTDDGVKFVDEEDDVLGPLDLVHDRLDAFLELAAVLGARHEGKVKGDDTLVAEEFGNVAGGDLLGESFGDGGLADARFTDEDGIVLGAAAENLDDPLDLAATTDHRIQFTVVGQLGEVAPKGFQRGRLAFLAIAAGAGFLELAFLVLCGISGKVRVEFTKDLVAGTLDVDIEVLENTRGNSVSLAKQSEKNVLGPDVAVIEGFRFLSGEGEDLLDAWGVGDVPHHLGLGSVADLLLHFESHGLEVEIHFLQDVYRHPLTELDKPQQKVLGAHVVVVETVRLLAGKGENLLCSGGEVIHRRCPCR